MIDRLVVVLLVTLVAGGCALVPRGQPLYAGAERPKEQVAWITGHVHSIDGRSVTANPAMGTRTGPAYELLPGRYAIALTADYPHATRWLPEYRMEFEAKAGHLYIARPGLLNGPPQIQEASSFRQLAYGPFTQVGKPAGRAAEALPQASDGQGGSWKVAVRSTSRIEPAVAGRMFSAAGHGEGLLGLVVHAATATRVRTHEERTLAGESMVVRTHFAMGSHERWVKGHAPTARGYHLEVAVTLQYLGPDGEIAAPRVWLVGTGGFVMRMLAAAGAPKDSPAAEPGLLEWLVSGQDPDATLYIGQAPPRRTRRLRSSESFGETALRYYFQVGEGVLPDQLWLAVEDVPPLKLPPISRVY